MAKNKDAYAKARAMVEQDFQEDPNAPYQEDQGAIDAANSALHTAGNMQRQTYKQMGDASQAEQTAKEEADYQKKKAEALAKKKGK